MLPFATTIFLGAFLLFQVQPLIGRIIVPWFGGGPAVWMTCMLFFQTLLLAGYLYAHLLARWLAPRKQAWIHLGLLFVSLYFLPIYPNPDWKTSVFGTPALRILLLLTCTVGLPGMAIAATGPLLQRWFFYHLPDRSPYRLYSLSNIGSVLALTTYPFLIEPKLGSHAQADAWSLLFILYAASCMWCSWRLGTVSETGRLYVDPGDPAPEAVEAPSPRPGVWKIALWLALSAIGSAHLMAGTNQLCQEVAAVPFLWVLPLTAYLVTFILAFDTPSKLVRLIGAALIALGTPWVCVKLKLERGYIFRGDVRSFDLPIAGHGLSPIVYLSIAAGLLALAVALPRARQWYNRWAGGVLMLTAMPLAGVLLHIGVWIPLLVQIAGYLYIIFACCMVCHGELARAKPPAGDLTLYYLTIAAGGALGGCFVALGAPKLFTDYWEYEISLAAVALIAIALWLAGVRGGRGPRWPAVAWFAAIMLWGIIAMAFGYIGDILPHSTQLAERLGLARTEPPLVNLRGFYGVLHVDLDSDSIGQKLTLRNGRIMHGFEYTEPDLRLRPTSYYTPESGIGLAIRQNPRRRDPDPARRGLRIGAIGQGVGTLLGLAEEGDTVRYYEINPQVLDVANRIFFFTRESAARYESALGDGRIQMEKELKEKGSDQFDVIAIDAFTSDAIPMHLLTVEAAQLYSKHLKADGILAIHITNRYINLAPVVLGMAETIGLKATMIDADAKEATSAARSQWVMLTNNQEWLDQPNVGLASEYPVRLPAGYKPVVWTDDNASLWPLLRF